jgi:pimeloyl-ACP methyl ester carboxylesterase
MKSRSILILIIITLFYSCSSKNDGLIGLDNFTELNSQSEGSGTFPFVYNSNTNKSLDVYCHIPENSDSRTPIVFLFHGNNRNANEYRNSLVAKANLYGFILLVPEFTTTQFPGGDGYNLGNVFTDGDNPSASSLNNESEWAFSVIEPLFTYAIQNLNNQSSKYHIIGHSAGAQFAHRFLFFKPLARIDKMVASAAGWYTTLDLETNFPYGINASPLEEINFSLLFSKQLTILVGSNDNDPNSSALRHNSIVDLQGLNRLDRAISFYNNAQSKAADLNVNFEWDFVINPNEDHNYLIAVSKASDIIFNP